jgi:hypothetical protein
MVTKKPVVEEADDNDFVSPELIQSYINKFNTSSKGTIERNSTESLKWFQRRISKDTNPSRMSLINNPGDYKTRKGNEKGMLIGRMYYFKYQAESPGDQELPIYDQYPMVFIFNTSKTQDGKNLIHALNVHYLQPRERSILLLKLLKLKNNKTYTHRTKLKLSWELIKSHVDHSLYQKAVHAYRVDRIKSRLIEIFPSEWEIAVFLQLQRWQHITNETVYSSDVRKIHRDRARGK